MDAGRNENPDSPASGQLSSSSASWLAVPVKMAASLY
jgi:hypothetical protein